MNALTFDLLLYDHVTKLESEAGSKLTVDHEGHGPVNRVRSKYQVSRKPRALFVVGLTRRTLLLEGQRGERGLMRVGVAG